MARSRMSCWWRVEVPTVLSRGRAEQFAAHVGKGGMKVVRAGPRAFAAGDLSNSDTRPARNWSVLDARPQIRFVVVAETSRIKLRLSATRFEIVPQFRHLGYHPVLSCFSVPAL